MWKISNDDDERARGGDVPHEPALELAMQAELRANVEQATASSRARDRCVPRISSLTSGIAERLARGLELEPADRTCLRMRWPTEPAADVDARLHALPHLRAGRVAINSPIERSSVTSSSSRSSTSRARPWRSSRVSFARHAHVDDLAPRARDHLEREHDHQQRREHAGHLEARVRARGHEADEPEHHVELRPRLELADAEAARLLRLVLLVALLLGVVPCACACRGTRRRTDTTRP